MNNIQNVERRFWDRFANFYDFFIDKVFRRTYKTILKNIDSDLNLNQNVLEIGTGTGIIPFSIYSKVSSVIATDISPKMVGVANKKLSKTNICNIDFQMQDSHNLKFLDNSFDLVIASNLFHLIPEPEKLITEIKRVMKADGFLIAPTLCVGENTRSKYIATVIGSISGFKIYNKWNYIDFISMLKDNGLVILKEQRIEDKILTAYVVLRK